MFSKFLSLFFVFSFLVFVGGVFDYLSTVLCLSVGFVELNPISLVVFPTLATYVIIFIGFCFMLISCLSIFVDVSCYVVYGVLGCLVVVSFYPCVHNLLLFVLR